MYYFNYFYCCLIKVHYIPDACHNLKLARNALATYKVFKSDNGLIEWNHIEELHKSNNCNIYYTTEFKKKCLYNKFYHNVLFYFSPRKNRFEFCQ